MSYPKYIHRSAAAFAALAVLFFSNALSAAPFPFGDLPKQTTSVSNTQAAADRIQQQSAVPSLNGPVNDTASIMSAEEKQQLTSYLLGLDEQTGVQMAVLTIPSLNGEAIEDYSMRAADAWKLGQKGKDNGALLVVSMAEHKIRIEVGYGLEEKLTDAKCGLIIRRVISPHFKDGEYGKGIIEGVQNMAGIATDNAQIVSKAMTEPEPEESSGLPLAAIIFLVIYFFLFTGILGSRIPLLGWLPWVALFHHSTHSRGSDFYYTSNHHDSFGGGFGGGSSGGGFSGGGGGFGGGGASGSW